MYLLQLFYLSNLVICICFCTLPTCFMLFYLPTCRSQGFEISKAWPSDGTCSSCNGCEEGLDQARTLLEMMNWVRTQEMFDSTQMLCHLANHYMF